jgi:hypothetical protein
MKDVSYRRRCGLTESVFTESGLTEPFVSQKTEKGGQEFGCSVASFCTSLILILIKKCEPYYWLISNKEQTKYLVVDAQV